MHRAVLGAVKYNLPLSPPFTSLPVNCLVLYSEESGILQGHPHRLHLEQPSSLTNLVQRQGKAALRWNGLQRMFAAAHRCVKCGSGSKIIIIIILLLLLLLIIYPFISEKSGRQPITVWRISKISHVVLEPRFMGISFSDLLTSQEESYSGLE